VIGGLQLGLEAFDNPLLLPPFHLEAVGLLVGCVRPAPGRFGECPLLAGLLPQVLGVAPPARLLRRLTLEVGRCLVRCLGDAELALGLQLRCGPLLVVPVLSPGGLVALESEAGVALDDVVLQRGPGLGRLLLELAGVLGVRRRIELVSRAGRSYG
jgi:hypothetical protein